MTTPAEECALGEQTPLIEPNDHNEQSQNDDQHNSQNFHSHHAGDHHHFVSLSESVPLYAPPRQRQRWGEEQILPHVNWGDLFFDLFYVAAAFNLDGIMEHDPSLQGLLYYVCCYLPICIVWGEKLAYDAKFAPDDNLFHRGWELVHLGVVGTAIQHIQTVPIMSQTTKYPTTMVLAGALCVECWLQLVRYKDVYYNVEGGEEAIHDARFNLSRKFLLATIFMSAAFVAGYDFFFKPSTQATNDIPIIICGLSYFVDHTYAFLHFAYFIPKSGIPYNELRVPINLELSQHRFGEWVMLMLGESVLSLLIAPQSNGARYYVTFYTGVTAVTMLQYLFFRTQPFAADDHAGRRSILGALLFYEMLTVFSGCLIVFGGAYKLTLDQYVLEQTLQPGAMVGLYTLEQRRGRIANLFCWSLAIGILALDFMIVSHRGFKDNCARFRNPDTGALKVVPAIISLANLSLLVFTATLSMWVQNLELMSVFGLLAVAGNVLLRTFGLRYFPVSKRAMDLALGRLSVPASS